MKLENQNIVIVSNEPWGDIWYSKHNYANELSKKNRVFFIDPPKRFRFGNFFNFKIHEKKIHPTLSVIEYSNLFPVSLFGLWWLNDILILKRLHTLFDKKKTRNIIFWTFDPIRLFKPKLLKPYAVVLHAVDAYLFTYRSETILAKNVNLIVSVSEKISQNYSKLNKNIITIPHVVPDDEFLPLEHKRNNPLNGLFIGKIDLRIDFDFNIEVFRSFPNIVFTIVGIVDDEFRKKLITEKIHNVSLIPAISSAELKNYIHKADFCFIFKKIYSGNNISSHKLLQYLAQGKPIFGTDFTDLDKTVKDTLYLSNDISIIKKALSEFGEKGESSDLALLRVNYAKQHTFSQAISKIEIALNASGVSNPYLYYDQLSFKTRLFNVIRKRFANKFIDGFFAMLLQKFSFTKPIVSRLVAPEYLYNNPSPRYYQCNGIKMNLNISNLVDHCIYFSTDQKAIDRFITQIKPNDTVIDIGANIGYTALQFSRACEKGSVYAIEPSKVLFKTVEDHLSLNEVKNTKVLNIGLGEKEETVRLYKVSTSNSGMNRVLKDNDAPFDSESIIIKRLDNVVAEQNIQKVNAIKIDVEGYEYKILKGAFDTLKKFHPILLIEIDDLNLKEQQSSPIELFEFLFDLNYSLFNASSMTEINLNDDFTGVHFDIICFHKTI